MHECSNPSSALNETTSFPKAGRKQIKFNKNKVYKCNLYV